MAARYAAFLWLLYFCLTAGFVRSGEDADSLDESLSTAFMSDMVQSVYFEESAIPVSQANMVLQTRDGYIWIASYDGLVRFDGKNSRVFGRVDGLGSDSVTYLHEDSLGRLWIATNNAGLFLLENGEGFRSFNRESGLASDTIRSIAQDSAGTIYVATSLGLSSVSPDLTVGQVRRGRGRAPIMAQKVLVDRDDHIWCLRDNNSILVAGRAGNTIRDTNAETFGGIEFNSLYQDRGGRIYLGSTENKVVVFDDPRLANHRMLETGSRTNINGFYEDNDGRVWVCSDTGMGYFRGDVFHPVDGAILNNSLENMFQDYEGGYWFSSSRKGVLHASKSKFRDASLSNRLPELTVNSTRYYGKKLYLGADEGLVILRTDGTRVYNELTKRLDGIRIRCLSSDDAGNLWICTYQKYGIIRYREDDGTFVSLTGKQGLPHNRVRCALPLRDGSVAVGTNAGLCFIKDDQVVRVVGFADGMTNGMILSLCETEDGTVYAGSDGGGIYQIDASGIVRNITTKDGLGADVILRLSEDPLRGYIWISTGNGVFLLRDGEITAVDKLESLAMSVFDIKFGRDGNLWLLTSKGVCLVNGATLFGDGPLQSELFTRRDGLTSTVTANSWSHHIDDGRLFISCNRGVIVTDTDHVRRNLVEPKLAVNQVIIDDEVYERPKSVRIPSDARRLTIDFAVLSYSFTSGNEVTVWLEGFDEKPIRLSTDLTTMVSYTNLPGGRYRFHLTGKNKEGMESSPLILPIRKELHILEQPLVRAGLVLGGLAALLGLGWLYFLYKTRALRKRQEEYRSITNQAISAIADTIDAKDEYTAGHSKRVAHYSTEIAKRMGVREEELENLYYTALLHDIGKIGLEDSILKKHGSLTDEEYAKMKRHPVIGGDILKSITVVNNIADGARYHHERYDGKGYPTGMKGEDIPLFARIICIADAFDAMSTNRPYRDSLNREYILNELERCSGQQFDKAIVPYMVEVAKEHFGTAIDN